MFVKKVVQGVAEPVLIANFQGKARLGREFFQKRLQPGQKIRGCRKCLLVEVGKLQKNHTELFFQRFCGTQNSA